MRRYARLLTLLSLLPAAVAGGGDLPTIGKIERLDPRLDEVLPAFARIEVLASGFGWSEGPVWVPAGNKAVPRVGEAGMLLFSDVPRNTVYRWTEADGVSEFMTPSGYTGVADYSSEPGSNGLTLDAEGRLTLCEHGDRRVSRLTAGGGKTTLADHFEGKRFNSPNDLVFAKDGSLYFTDPPYGLPERENSKLKELDAFGVYRVSPDGEITLATDVLTRPNGIGLSPEGTTLYVANSDPERAVWMAFPVTEDGSLGEGRIFYDATEEVSTLPGLPDGLAVDTDGRLWTTGPGGVWVFTADGTPLGRIDTGQATANCAFGGPDGKSLFITADGYLCRVQTKAVGLTAAR